MFYRLLNDKIYDYADYQYADDCLETDIITQAELDKDKSQVVVEEYQEEVPQEEEEPIVITKYRLILNPNYEQEEAEKERIRIANLHMTRGDVFRGLLLAKGVTRADMRGLIEAMPEETPKQRIAKEYALIDFDEALEFYRGVALIDTVGAQLGITPKQMDRFFDTKDWHELISEEENV